MKYITKIREIRYNEFVSNWKEMVSGLAEAANQLQSANTIQQCEALRADAVGMIKNLINSIEENKFSDWISMGMREYIRTQKDFWSF